MNPGSWFNRGHRPGLPEPGPDGLPQLPNIAPNIENEIRKQAAATSLPVEHMIRLARQEQGGYRNVSLAGAIGPMQLMPGTAAEMHVDPWDWRQNITGGLRYYAQLMDKFHGDVRAADAAYNAGPNSKAVAAYAANHALRTGLPSETQSYTSCINGIETPAAAAIEPPPRVPPTMHIAAGPIMRLDAPNPDAAPPTQTLQGSASLKITLGGFPMGTQTSSNVTGNVFAGPPEVRHAMLGDGA